MFHCFSLHFTSLACILMFWLDLSCFGCHFDFLARALTFQPMLWSFSSAWTFWIALWHFEWHFELFYHPNFLRFFSKSDSSLYWYILHGQSGWCTGWLWIRTFELQYGDKTTITPCNLPTFFHISAQMWKSRNKPISDHLRDPCLTSSIQPVCAVGEGE